MEARPTDLVLVDERDLEAELGRTERGGIPAGARTEHDEIEIVGGADGHGSGASERLDAGGPNGADRVPGGQVGHRSHRRGTP